MTKKSYRATKEMLQLRKEIVDRVIIEHPSIVEEARKYQNFNSRNKYVKKCLYQTYRNLEYDQFIVFNNVDKNNIYSMLRKEVNKRIKKEDLITKIWDFTKSQESY